MVVQRWSHYAFKLFQVQELESLGSLISMLNETFSGLLQTAPDVMNSSSESQVICINFSGAEFDVKFSVNVFCHLKSFAVSDANEF